MPVIQPVPQNEGSYRFSGVWGSAWKEGVMLAELVEVSAPVERGRIAVPIVGSQREGHKIGRETREGTMTVQKFDSYWEKFVYDQISQSVAARRAARDAGDRKDYSFSLVLKYDDPEALGIERWQLDGVLLWRLPLGFNIGDELVQREYPITWETETPLDAFQRSGGTGVPTAQYYAGMQTRA
jgi:hypothetical protein